jgi:TRAP transporter TAXI family solute receptor
MKTRRSFLATTVAMGGLATVGGVSTVLGDAPSFKGKTFIRIGTAGSGGNTYRVGAGLAALFNEKLTDIKLQTSVQATGGSVHNMELLANKEVEIATAGGSTANAAYHNLRQYADRPQDRYKGVQFVSSIYPNPVWFVAMKWAPDVKSLRDLKGKRVSIGMIGSQGESVWKRISKIIGFKPDDIEPEYTSHQSAIDQVRNRQIDAVVIPDAAGAASITQMMDTGFARIVDMDNDVIMAMTKNTLDFPYMHPMGSVSGMDKERKTWASSVVLVARADVQEELVYRMIKTVFENQDYLIKIHPITRFWVPKTALDGQTGDLHPGAIKYYKEIGML